MEYVARGLLTRDPDAERGIGEALFHNAGEFNDVFGHRESEWARKAERSYGWKEAWTRRRDGENLKGPYFVLNYNNIIL